MFPYKLLKLLILTGILAFSAQITIGQRPKPTPAATPENITAVRGSAAFAEVTLRKAETDAELETLAADYTEDFPRIKELRFTSSLLEEDIKRLYTIKADEAGKLTLALGKLMLRRLDAAIELWRLRQSYADNHPDVRRAIRRWEIFTKAIDEILGPVK